MTFRIIYDIIKVRSYRIKSGLLINNFNAKESDAYACTFSMVLGKEITTSFYEVVTLVLQIATLIVAMKPKE